MSAINELLDKVRETCSIPSDLALAARLGRSRALVSEWRKGAKQVQDAEIARLAEMAKQDAGLWMVRVHAEQEAGAAGRAWQRLARQLGAAASLAVVALMVSPAPAKAETLTGADTMHYAK